MSEGLETLLADFQASGGVARAELGSADLDAAVAQAVSNVKRSSADNLKLLRCVVSLLMQAGACEPAPETVARVQGLAVAIDRAVPRQNATDGSATWVLAPPSVLRLVVMLIHIMTRGVWLTAYSSTRDDPRTERIWLSLARYAPTDVHARLISLFLDSDLEGALRLCEAIATRQENADPISRALASAFSQRGLEEFALAELLNCEPCGPKPLLGSAPSAVTLVGAKASNYTVLDRLASYRAEHAHHGLLLSVLINQTEWNDDVTIVLRDYFDRVANRILEFFEMTSAPLALFGTQQAPGLNFIVAVAREAIAVLKRVDRRQTAAALITALLAASRVKDIKVACEAAPEYRVFDLMIPRASPGVSLLSAIERFPIAVEAQRTSILVEEMHKIFALSFQALSTPGTMSYVTATLLRLPESILVSCVKDLSSSLLCGSLLQPHASAALLERLIPLAVNQGSPWFADAFIRISFAPLVVFAMETEVEGEPGEADPIFDFICELGTPTTIHRLGDLCVALNQLPVEEAAFRWGAVIDAIGPMSTRMLAAARLVHPLMVLLGQAAADPHCIPISMMSMAIGTARFLVAPQTLHSTNVNVVLSISKRLLVSAPVAVIEASVAPVVDLLLLPPETLAATDDMVSICSWAMSTLCSALESIAMKQPLSGAAIALFDAIHDLIWLLVGGFSGDCVGPALHSLNDLDAAIANFRLSQPHQSAPVWSTSNFATPLMRREEQLVHCCLTTMTLLATIEPTLVDKTLVCIANVWRATHRSVPSLAEVCVSCSAVVGHGVQKVGVPNLQVLLGATS